jgi:hypothetical protein
MRELLAQSGFGFVGADQSEFRMRFADGSSLLRHAFIRLGFVPAWMEIAEPAVQSVVLERLESNLNALAAEQGELRLSIPMACVEARKPSAARRG